MSKRKATRKLFPSEIRRRLEAMAVRWPDGIQLFASCDSLLIVDTETLEVLGDILVPCDGGDSGTYKEDDREYLDVES